MTQVSKDYETLLHESCADFHADPLGFVMFAYPWGEPGSLQQYDGPDVWQEQFLQRLGKAVLKRGFNGKDAVDPIRMAASKGHGVGGSALAAWLVDWIMSTRPHCHGTVTANTSVQLQTKTWAAVQRWTSLCRTAHWFEINNERMYRKGHRASWFCAPQSCREENSEAFAGQHAADSTSFYINDEDSAVPDKIHEVEEGGLTDGESMQFLFGNCTRNTGYFHKACFGSLRHRYDTIIIDSRKSKFTNKAQIDQWEADYGEDSDFFRVRVMGLPPQASELQFIDNLRVWQAQKNGAFSMPNDPLIAGVDVSGGGAAWTVCRFRRGLDARSIPPIRINGENTVKDDRQMVISALGEALSRRGKDRIDAMFVDTAFGAPVVVALRNRGFNNVFEVNFGGASIDPRYENQRAYQYGQVKEWLPKGAIPKDDTRLESDLCGPGYHLNKRNRLVLESKQAMQERGLASPDDSDALSLTFAQPVALVDESPVEEYRPTTTWG